MMRITLSVLSAVSLVRFKPRRVLECGAKQLTTHMELRAMAEEQNFAE
jgi:hypothetical protein